MGSVRSWIIFLSDFALAPHHPPAAWAGRRDDEAYHRSHASQLSLCHWPPPTYLYGESNCIPPHGHRCLMNWKIERIDISMACKSPIGGVVPKSHCIDFTLLVVPHNNNCTRWNLFVKSQGVVGWAICESLNRDNNKTTHLRIPMVTTPRST